ncbi:MAG: AMP-binding protein [Polyangiales bacterium]
MGLQVGQILRQAARFAPEACAVVDLGHRPEDRREVSFAGLHQLACGVASELARQGVAAGDRVAIVAENSLEVAAAWFGIVYAGAAVVPLHLLSAAPELGQRLAHADVKLVLHDAVRGELVRAALASASSRAPALSLADAAGWPVRSDVRYPLDTAPQTTAMVLYTSGTTGRPKGAAITHASLLMHTLLLVQHGLGLDESSRVLCTLPLSHSYGCRLAMLAPFYARARLVVLPRFDPQRSVDVMREEGVTWVPAVPTMFAAWGQLSAAEQRPLPSLRWALCAGAPLADATAERAEAVLGVEVRQGYGMTEATFSTLNAPPDQRVLGSVGKPAWGVELRIVDDAGHDVPAGARGQVLVRGHNVMSQYLFDSEATDEALPDGWVQSGDVGQLDDAGRLYIVDRIKDLIIRGGYNVFPSEIENVLGSHPGVHAIAVVGRPDDYYGEEVVAVVVAREGSPPPSAAQLHTFGSQRMARHKLPREYVFTSDLPLGASGKVHKRTLRDRLVSGQLKPEKVTG